MFFCHLLNFLTRLCSVTFLISSFFGISQNGALDVHSAGRGEMEWLCWRRLHKFVISMQQLYLAKFQGFASTVCFLSLEMVIVVCDVVPSGWLECMSMVQT